MVKLVIRLVWAKTWYPVGSFIGAGGNTTGGAIPKPAAAAMQRNFNNASGAATLTITGRSFQAGAAGTASGASFTNEHGISGDALDLNAGTATLAEPTTDAKI